MHIPEGTGEMARIAVSNGIRNFQNSNLTLVQEFPRFLHPDTTKEAKYRLSKVFFESLLELAFVEVKRPCQRGDRVLVPEVLPQKIRYSLNRIQILSTTAGSAPR